MSNMRDDELNERCEGADKGPIRPSSLPMKEQAAADAIRRESTTSSFGGARLADITEILPAKSNTRRPSASGGPVIRVISAYTQVVSEPQLYLLPPSLLSAPRAVAVHYQLTRQTPR